MSTQQSFELPTQRFGEVIPHDLYTPEQERLFEIIDSFGKNVAARTIEIAEESEIQTVETFGQYL